MIVLEDDLPDSVKNLQQYFGDGTSNDLTNVFYKELGTEQDFASQARNVLKEHLTVSDWYGFDDDHIQTFLRNLKLISETKLENSESLNVLKDKLFAPHHFKTSLLMDQLLNNRDDDKEASESFNKTFITLDNSMVQLFYTSDEDIFIGVVVAANDKGSPHAVYLVFVID